MRLLFFWVGQRERKKSCGLVVFDVLAAEGNIFYLEFDRV